MQKGMKACTYVIARREGSEEQYSLVSHKNPHQCVNGLPSFLGRYNYRFSGEVADEMVRVLGQRGYEARSVDFFRSRRNDVLPENQGSINLDEMMFKESLHQLIKDDAKS